MAQSAGAQVLSLYIDDTSPSVAYFPFGDTFTSPALAAGWNPYFTGSGFAAFQGEIGVGQSRHRTEKNGAEVSVTWAGEYHCSLENH